MSISHEPTDKQIARAAAGLFTYWIAAPIPGLTAACQRAAAPGTTLKVATASGKLARKYKVPVRTADQTIGRVVLRGLVLAQLFNRPAKQAKFYEAAAVSWCEAQLNHPVVLARLRSSQVVNVPNAGLALVDAAGKITPNIRSAA